MSRTIKGTGDANEFWSPRPVKGTASGGGHGISQYEIDCVNRIERRIAKQIIRDGDGESLPLTGKCRPNVFNG